MAVLNATLSSLAFPLTKRAIFFSGRPQREKATPTKRNHIAARAAPSASDSAPLCFVMTRFLLLTVKRTPLGNQYCSARH